MPQNDKNFRVARYEYFRLQTLGMLGTWTGLLAVEWAKPGIVANRFAPGWVLLGLLISATVTAFLNHPHPVPAWPRRWVMALVAGTVVLLGVSTAVSSPFGWLVAVAVWGAIVSALGTRHDYD